MLNKFPNIGSELLINFESSKTTHPILTVKRTSAGGYFGKDGRWLIAPNNFPRIEYDRATGRCLGLLSENASTNLLLDSATQTPWILAKIIREESTIDGLFGKKATAYRCNNSTGLQTRGILNIENITQNTYYTFSMYVKKGSNRFIRVTRSPTETETGDDCAFIDLETGELRVITETIAHGFSIKDMGDGWWKVSLTFLSNTETIARLYIVASRTLGSPSIDPTGLVLFNLCGVQLEASKTSTSYIETASSQVTRQRDYIYFDKFSDYYNPEQGTFVAAFDGMESSQNAAGFGFLACSANSSDHVIGIGMFKDYASETYALRVRKNNSDRSALLGTQDRLRRSIGVISYSKGVSIGSFDGVRVSERDDVTIPETAPYLYLGGNSRPDSAMNGHLRFIYYFPVSTTLQEVMALSKI